MPTYPYIRLNANCTNDVPACAPCQTLNYTVAYTSESITAQLCGQEAFTDTATPTTPPDYYLDVSFQLQTTQVQTGEYSYNQCTGYSYPETIPWTRTTTESGTGSITYDPDDNCSATTTDLYDTPTITLPIEDAEYNGRVIFEVQPSDGEDDIVTDCPEFVGSSTFTGREAFDFPGDGCGDPSDWTYSISPDGATFNASYECEASAYLTVSGWCTVSLTNKDTPAAAKTRATPTSGTHNYSLDTTTVRTGRTIHYIDTDYEITLTDVPIGSTIIVEIDWERAEVNASGAPSGTWEPDGYTTHNFTATLATETLTDTIPVTPGYRTRIKTITAYYI